MHQIAVDCLRWMFSEDLVVALVVLALGWLAGFGG
jgi:hypothetical protein